MTICMTRLVLQRSCVAKPLTSGVQESRLLRWVFELAGSPSWQCCVLAQDACERRVGLLLPAKPAEAVTRPF